MMNFNTKYLTLVDVIKSFSTSEDTGIFFVEGSDKEVFYSYQEIYSSALSLVHTFHENGISKGDELVFQLRDNKDFVVAFWACILSGVIPIPLSSGNNAEQKLKVSRVWKILKNPYLITTGNEYRKLNFIQETEKIILIDEHVFTQRSPQIIEPSEDDIAYVQFSSGSTGIPKGVTLTHKNLISNIKAIHQGIDSPESGDTFYSWMPLTHDMGLIGFHLTPMFANWNHYIMPTELFIRNPNIWLRKVSEHKITFTSSPNFGYKYALKHFKKEEDRELDLSSLRIIVNGAEPISSSLCTEFNARFMEFGLKKNVIFPVYGLAEASLAVSFSKVSEELITLEVDRKSLSIGDVVVDPGADLDSISFVGLGKAIDYCEFQIADNEGNPVSEGVIGHIRIKGDNVTSGYYRNEEATRVLINEEGWLDTGDLGFVKEDNLYVTGRQKDVLFINGQNYYSNDLERCAEEVEGIELGKIIITGYFDTDLQREKIVAFVHHKGNLDKFIPMHVKLKKFINQSFGFELDEMIPVSVINKTTSGKVQRYLMLEHFRNGLFNESLTELKELLSDYESTQVSDALPKTDTEKKLWNSWNDILGQSNFGIDDSFFEVGGNSLKAGELIAKLLFDFNVELTFEAIFMNPSIKALAGVVDQLPKTTRPLIDLKSLDQKRELSESQRRLYYVWELDRKSIAYNIPTAVELSGILDREKLEKTIIQLSKRHAVLKSAFKLIDGKPLLVEATYELEIVKEKIDKAKLDAHLKSLVRPFDLSCEQLFRVHLIELEEAENILFLDFHHIVADGISVHLFIEELTYIYSEIALRKLDYQYSDFVNWEVHQNEIDAYAKARVFWSKEFEKEIPLLNLPLDNLRPSVLEYHGVKQRITLDNDLVNQIQLFAKEHNVSTFMLLLALYKVQLSKYTSQEDIVVGVPVSGRNRLEFDTVFGMFVNNVAVRSYPDGTKSFLQFLNEIKDKSFQVLENGAYPFGQLVNDLKQRRDVGRNPVFDTMFVYQNIGFNTPDNCKIAVSRYFFDPGFSKYDISLEVFENKGKLDFYIEYNTSLFEADTITQFIIGFKTLMTNAISNPESELKDLEILDENQVGKQNLEFSNSISDETFVDLFEKTVRLYENEIAIIEEDREFTFKGLNDEVNNLAHRLADIGIEKENAVAILTERSADFIIGVLATLKAGACFVPIDTELPNERVNYLINDSGARIILSKSDYVAKINSGFEGEIILLDSDELKLDSTKSENLSRDIKPENLAYILYTSGTTGRPKGVEIEHQSIVNYSEWAVGAYFQKEKVTIPFYTSVSFDLTLTSIFPPLISGNTIRIYKEDDKSLTIDRIISENHCEIIKLTPSHLKVLLNNTSKVFQNQTSKVRKLIVGGENLTAQLAGDITTKFKGNVEIYNEYGPTEATVGCMLYKYDNESKGSVPIGKPIINTGIYILNRYLKPVPVGVEGELYISGRGLARGYHQMEKNTDEKFVHNAFVKGQKMYRSGDIAKCLANGNIEYVGRIDQQVKINGYRIELSEIASQLATHDNIKDVVVIDHLDASGEKYLCAYYVTNNGNEIAFEELYMFLTERLPKYMIPSFYVALPVIELTSNGKVNSELLPLPNRKGTSNSDADLTDMELLLRDIWEDVLQVENLNVKDNFFQYGGDSIKAIQIVSRLNNADYVVSIKEILKYQTIDQLARYVLPASDQNYVQGIVSGEYSPTPVMNWFFGQELEAMHYYNQSVVLQFPNGIDKSLLEKSFEKIIRQHDGLRMNYSPEKHKMFYNGNHVDSAFIIDSISINSSDEKERKELFNHIGKSVKSSFDCTSDLLLKSILINDRASEEFLLITAHHLIIDGVSWRIILEDLFAVYNSIANGTEYVEHKKTASLIDWYEALMRVTESRKIEDQRIYWDSMKAPDGSAQKPVSLENYKRVDSTLSKEETTCLVSEISGKHNTTVEIILLTALMLAVKDVFNEDIKYIELESHGRSLDGINVSRTVGWFTALFPVRLELAGASLLDQIFSIKEQIKNIPDNGIGYGLLNHFPDADAHTSVSDFRFNYLGKFDFQKESDLFSISDYEMGADIGLTNKATTNLDVVSMIRNGKLTTSFQYNSVSYDGESIGRLNEIYNEKLIEIVNFLKVESEEVHFSPSDFELADLSQEDLDNLFN